MFDHDGAAMSEGEGAEETETEHEKLRMIASYDFALHFL